MDRLWSDWLIVIPARLKSTRLPEKPLQDLAGKPLIVRVYERLKPLVALGAEIVVATDSEKVQEVCSNANVPCTLTSESHESGTDRVFEVSQAKPQEYILNVQGDEPFVNIQDLERLAQRMASKKLEMGCHRQKTFIYY